MKALLIGGLSQVLLDTDFIRKPKSGPDGKEIVWLAAKSFEELEGLLRTEADLDVVIFVDYLDRDDKNRTAIRATMNALELVRDKVPARVEIITSTCNKYIDEELSRYARSNRLTRPELWLWFARAKLAKA
jgi:hypothetical protein